MLAFHFHLTYNPLYIKGLTGRVARTKSATSSRNILLQSLSATTSCGSYIIPPIPPISGIPIPPAAGSGMSATTASVVKNSEATDAAF